MSKVEVVEVNEATALAAFDGKVKLQDILNHVATVARAFNLDASTSIGRKEITSVAYKVSRSKTLIDGVGKDIVSEIKAKAKVIDVQRKEARDFLDALRDEIRQPVTDFEAEQERIQQEEIEKAEAEEAARIADIERREAELLAKEEAARAKAEAERLEKDRIEREARIAKEAAEFAKIEAERKAQKARDDAEAREREAIKAKERVEREMKEAAELSRLKAEESARQARLDAEQAKRQAEQDAKEAVEREKERVRQEKAREDAAAKAREADKQHKTDVNNAAMKAISTVGVSVETAKAIVRLIARGEVPNVKVLY